MAGTGIPTRPRRGKRVKYTQLGATRPEVTEHSGQPEFTTEPGPVVSVSGPPTRKRKGRGPSALIPARLAKDRPVIWPVGSAEFDASSDAGSITKVITKLVLKLMPSPCLSFLFYDVDSRNLLQAQFLVKSMYLTYIQM
jgi:hypothetical protein